MLVVFNNNRSKRFFVKQFTTLGCASFLPKVLAIDEFISQLGGLEIVPNEFLLFELYNIREDIGEKHNRAADRPDKVAELARLLGARLRAWNASMPVVRATGKPVPYPDELPLQ